MLKLKSILFATLGGFIFGVIVFTSLYDSQDKTIYDFFEFALIPAGLFGSLLITYYSIVFIIKLLFNSLPEDEFENKSMSGSSSSSGSDYSSGGYSGGGSDGGGGGCD
ncbi:MAG: putative membrane protein YgcG [Cognaticolwellia sp.]|jgi:uncharacterized membrane protein YgcG